MSAIFDYIDLGNYDNKAIPYSERKSIALLLGAGFSAPMGYPIGNDMNEYLLNFDDRNVDFSPSGVLASSIDGTKPNFQIGGVLNNHQKYFVFCKKLIKEYAQKHGNRFDYEEFFDFIKSDEPKDKDYQRLLLGLCEERELYEEYLYNVPHIYNQMVAHLLKDKTGKTWYDDEPFKMNYFDCYSGFLRCLSKLSEKYIVNVHTLNHDLLFESFNSTGFINGNISDGFDEYGSEYFGKLTANQRTYHCRLERFTGRYNTSIRLYKLHGSLDYVPFYKVDKYGRMIPDNYVKIRWGIGAGDIMKDSGSKAEYEHSPFEYHSDFLTGTTYKMKRYHEPLLYAKLFEEFKKNLRDAEKLIVIGYGCKDEGINEMIMECFDYKNKQSFFVDAYANEGSPILKFKEKLNAKLHRVQLEDLKESLFE